MYQSAPSNIGALFISVILFNIKPKMKTIKVNFKDGNYDIKIGSGFLKKINFRKFKASKFAIITDSNVKRLYGGKVKRFIQNQRLAVELFDFPAGEKSKNLKQAEKLGRELAGKEFDRNAMIIALGGGVTGDLAGFVASFYKRGIGYIQIPTTLVAQTDSSIGGKTGVDIPEGKNLFGCFHQPKAVFIDVNTLKTLPEKEIRNGLAEIIKYGMTQNVELFKELEKKFSKRNEAFFLKIVEKSCEIKARIVEKDEKEKDLRKILNYGHTIGHAIETAKNYKISHGEAVGLGMVYEGRISNKLGLLDDKSLERQNQLIKNIGLPINYKGKINKLVEIMKRDKKAKSGKLYFVLPTTIGNVKKEKRQVVFPVDEAIVIECLKSQ